MPGFAGVNVTHGSHISDQGLEVVGGRGQDHLVAASASPQYQGCPVEGTAVEIFSGRVLQDARIGVRALTCGVPFGVPQQTRRVATYPAHSREPPMRDARAASP